MDYYIVAFYIGIMAGAIFFIDGWGPPDKILRPEEDKSTAENKTSFWESRRFRGFSVILSGGIVMPLLDYVDKKGQPEFFLNYIHGSLWGLFSAFLLCLFCYLVWKSSIAYRDESKSILHQHWFFQFGSFLFSILDFIYYGISETNTHLKIQRKFDEWKMEELLKYEQEKIKDRIEEDKAARSKGKASGDNRTKEESKAGFAEKTEAVFLDFFNKGKTALDKQNYNEVISNMSCALENGNTNNLNHIGDAHLYIGLANDALGNHTGAIAEYDKIIEKYKNYDLMHIVYYDKGIALENLGRKADALAEYQRSIDTKKNYTNALNNKAAILLDLGKNAEALESALAAIDSNKEFPLAWNNKGVALERSGPEKWNEALKAYDEAIRLKNDFEIAIDNRKKLQEKIKKK